MLKQLQFCGAALFALALPLQVGAQDATAQTVIAKVGETEITLGELIVARTMLPPQYAQFPNEMLFEGLVDQLIQQQLLADALEAIPASVEYTVANERRALLAAEVITQLSADAVTPEALQAAYDARFADAADVPEFRASHLLVATQEDAAAAKARIDAGEAFADVARAVSTGPTGPNGGDLGWFGAGAMVPEFEDQILALELGAVSEPFETQFGWHVATLVDQRVQAKPSFDEMAPQLTAELQEAAVVAYLDELAAAAVVERPEAGAFDPNLIDQLDLLD